jgi:hypothetical protein
MADERLCVVVRWTANPLRGERFAEQWRPAAEAALRYGAHGWGLYRSLDGLHDFIQFAYFDSKLEWDRYWYSEEISAARAAAAGLFQVPVLPTFWEVVGTGELRRTRGGPGGSDPDVGGGAGTAQTGSLGPA